MLTHQGSKTLETSRLLLRKARREDALPMFRNWASDPEVTRFLTWLPYQKAEDAIPVLERWESGYQQPSFYLWMIELKEVGEPIGSISVTQLDEDVREAEIGYCIGRPWWHRGIMTEALTAVIDCLFREVGMNRIVAVHDVRNPHSGGVMKKCAMQLEGISRQSARNNQGICDEVHYAILRCDWEMA